MNPSDDKYWHLVWWVDGLSKQFAKKGVIVYIFGQVVCFFLTFIAYFLKEIHITFDSIREDYQEAKQSDLVVKNDE